MARLCGRLCTQMFRCSLSPGQLMTTPADALTHHGVQCRYMSAGMHVEDPDMANDLLFDENFDVKPFVDRHKGKGLLNKKWRIMRKIRSFFGELPPEAKSKEEIEEFNSIMHRLDDCYLEIPQRLPDEQWFLDYIDHCYKYHDFYGAQQMWEYFSRRNTYYLPNFRVSEEMVERWDKFYRDNKPKNLFEMSDRQRERRDRLEANQHKILEDPDYFKPRRIHLINPDKEQAMKFLN